MQSQHALYIGLNRERICISTHSHSNLRLLSDISKESPSSSSFEFLCSITEVSCVYFDTSIGGVSHKSIPEDTNYFLYGVTASDCGQGLLAHVRSLVVCH